MKLIVKIFMLNLLAVSISTAKNRCEEKNLLQKIEVLERQVLVSLAEQSEDLSEVFGEDIQAILDNQEKKKVGIACQELHYFESAEQMEWLIDAFPYPKRKVVQYLGRKQKNFILYNRFAFFRLNRCELKKLIFHMNLSLVNTEVSLLDLSVADDVEYVICQPNDY